MTGTVTVTVTRPAPVARLGFIIDARRPGECLFTLAQVVTATGNFGGNRDGRAVLEAIAPTPAARMRFALRTVAVAELAPGLMDTSRARIAELRACRDAGAMFAPIVVAGALLVDGNHRTALAVQDGQAGVRAFVLLTR